MADPNATKFEGSHIIRVNELVREVVILWIDSDPDHTGWWYDDGANDTNGGYSTSQEALAFYISTMKA